MNFATLHDESTASRCLGLIERFASQYMRGSSLGLPREVRPEARDLTLDDKKRIIAVALTAPNIPAIVAECGWTAPTIRKCLRDAGVPTPYLRITGIHAGAPRKRTGPRTSNIFSLNSKHHE